MKRILFFHPCFSFLVRYSPLQFCLLFEAEQFSGTVFSVATTLLSQPTAKPTLQFISVKRDSRAMLDARYSKPDSVKMLIILCE